jgi:hypothetical protein
MWATRAVNVCVTARAQRAWASDERGRQYRFVVEEVAAADIAA